MDHVHPLPGAQAPDPPGPSRRPTGRSLARRALPLIGVLIAVVVILWLLWYAADIFLLIFAGILLGVALSGASRWLSEHTPLSYGWALGGVVIGIILAFGLAAWFGGSQLMAQVDNLRAAVMQGAERLFETLEEYAWGRELTRQLPAPGEMLNSGISLFARATGIVYTMLDVIANIVIVLFLGLYIAVDPDLYRRGLLHLVPCEKRDAAGQTLDALAVAIRRWLAGTLVSMAIVGVLTGVALWVLGVPLAPALGLLAALLEFIPNLGPILSAVPGVLLAFTISPTLALKTVALYIAIQAIESYLIHPLVLKNAVALPPALTISALVLAGVLFGFIGLLLAAPLAAVTLVLVKILYVEDVLGDESVEAPGEEREPARE